MAGALLLAAGIEYKAFGTSKQFNTRPDDLDAVAFRSPFLGLNDAVYRKVRDDVSYRVAVDPVTGPFAPDLRHFGLATPGGFDPMMPAAYREKLKAWSQENDPRVLTLDPANGELLRSLGVRYFITAEAGRYYGALRSSPDYTLLEPSRGYFKVFELKNARPAYRWLAGDAASAEPLAWTPERREFRVRSAAGGRVVLVEQFFPGWRARIDGRPAPVERFDDVFQAVGVPAGEHRVEFEYRSRTLGWGSLVSALCLAGVGVFTARKPC